MLMIMGSCVSIHETPDLAKSSKTDKLLIPSPSNEKPVKVGHPIAEVSFKSQPSSTQPVITSSHDIGSKEEIFFDTQTWLESDSEDDFVSVKDFSASCSGTPGLQSSFIASKSRICDFKQEPSSIKETKQLVELLQDPAWSDKVIDHHNVIPPYREIKLVEFFQDSFWIEQVVANHNSPPTPTTLCASNGKSNQTILDLPSDFTNGSPFVSSKENSRPQYDHFKSEREKTAMVTPCCCPSLQKKRLIPPPSG